MVSFTTSRNLVEPLPTTSTEMVRAFGYQSVGMFEYLVNSHTGQWVFLEINSRTQVEYIVTGALLQSVRI